MDRGEDSRDGYWVAKASKSIYWEKKYCELYGYDIPVTHCYEGRGRTTRGELSTLKQAQLYVRDCLEALAYGAPTIKVGIICDVGNSYIYSRYGGGGICYRSPLLNPKPGFAANWAKLEGPEGDIEYPISLHRIIVELRDTVYCLTGTRPVKERSVCIRDVTAEYEERW